MGKKNKKAYIIIAIITILLLTLFIYLFLNKKDNKEQENLDNTPEQSESEDYLTSEEEYPEVPTTISENVTMKIISPEGETFEKSQARGWKAQLEGMETNNSFRVECHWEFFLNENNEEVLYEQMDNSSIVSKEDPDLCGFTSTFIDSRGKLRVKLTADIQNAYGESLKIFTAERSYTVL